MAYSEIKNLLEVLCKADGTSGAEGSAAEKAKELLSAYMPVSTDALGNITGKTGEKPVILLDAHIDQIGLVVTGIDEDGFVHVAKVGGSDIRVLCAANVTIHGKEDIFGIITSVPPHLSKGKDSSKAAKFDEITIDIGLTKEEADRIISIGDRITFNGPFDTLLGNRVASPSIDDRAGIVAVLRCLQFLEGKNICPVEVLFSVQEETGGSGAVTGAYNSGAEEAIAVDVSFASAPGVSKEKYASLGDGALIGYSPTLDYKMSKSLSSVAEKNSIKAVPEVMGGRTGTDGDDIQISKGGIRTALISIPIRNMHTAVEVCDLEDIECVAKLMAEYILERSRSND